jgi:phosphoribosyl 1,2-cyclic phosphodiesterase
MAFTVRFWGVRGSIACPDTQYMRYGGNTSCVSIQCGDRHLVLDAGSGLRGCGKWLVEQGARQATLLLSHTHWDHINGFPFFGPAYSPAFSLDVMAGHTRAIGHTIESVMAGQMSNPNFPVPLSIMAARMSFSDFDAGETLDLGDGVCVRTAPLNHPGGATGLRVEFEGRAACYVTDTEHRPGKPDQRVLALIAGADLVIYDSTYTDDEFPAKVGWGHSTWQEGVRLCRSAGARRLAITHHDPDHDDAVMERIEAAARAEWEGALVASDGMKLEVST